MKPLLGFIGLLFYSFLFAQESYEKILKQDTISLVDIYNYDQQTNEDITITKKIISNSRQDQEFLRGKSFRNSLFITDCEFIGGYGLWGMQFDSIGFKRLYLASNNYSSPPCFFTNCTFENEFGFFEDTKSDGLGYLFIDGCKFNSIVSIGLDHQGPFGEILIENSKFDAKNINLSFPKALPAGIADKSIPLPRQFYRFDSSYHTPSIGIINTGNEIDKLTFRKNEFVQRPKFEFQIKGKFNQLVIENNNFDSLGIVLGETSVSNKLYVVENKNIGFLGFFGFYTT